MKDILFKFQESSPEMLLTWKDPYTEARGWLVINSLKRGAVGGGTLMKIDLEPEELLMRAKIMELKYRIVGPQIGGAQGGIKFDPDDPRKKEVLSRWYKAMGPLLKIYYSTYGGENIDLIKDIIPNTEDIGIWHPYEGILTGYYDMDQPQKINRIGQLRKGTSMILENEINIPNTKGKHKLLDIVCGYGIAESVKHYYNLCEDQLNKKKVLIQGLGINSFYTAFYLMQNGAEIKGFIHEDQLFFKPEGFTVNELELLNKSKNHTEVAIENLITVARIDELIDVISIDTLVINTPLNYLTHKYIGELSNLGLELVVCGIDNAFDNTSIYNTRIHQVDEYVSIIPSFIATIGLPRFLTLLVENNIILKEEIILNDISDTIKMVLQNIFDNNSSKYLLLKKALEAISNKKSESISSLNNSLIDVTV